VIQENTGEHAECMVIGPAGIGLKRGLPGT
jgi:hypothetical protein